MRTEPQIPLLGRAPRRAMQGGSGQIDAILASCNTWAFKSEQPSNTVLLRQIVDKAVANQEPVPFILYWGKGTRTEPARFEVRCLEYLASLGD